MKKTYLKKDDNVQIMTGRDKGKKGRIISINRLKYTAIVEGANLVSKHTKPNQDNPKGGVIKKEASINISNLLLVDSKGKPSKIGKRINKKTGKKERFFKTTGDLVK
ncbi:MAG: 50S ribosomal protein L24 [Flavobacteriales bacterium]|nr:50S ribosomal protein L24 [Flavobacteriales bacterium]